jgi:hypothetical protein
LRNNKTNTEKMARITKDLQPTISDDLFEAWVKLRRKGDPEQIAEILGKSRPVIDKALKYGYVKDDAVVKGITKFYNDRLEAENKDAKKLLKHA